MEINKLCKDAHENAVKHGFCNVLSLFDGISCGQIALERAKIKVDKYYASEIKTHAIKITQANYPNTIQLGDITYIDDIIIKKIGKIDLMIGGSPCQDISLANRNGNGIYDPNSGLFWEYLRLLREIKPKYFLLENVVGRKSSIDAITNWLGVKPIMINSSLVAPQQRRRYYWTNIPGIEQPQDKGLLLKDTQTLDGDNDMNLYGSEKFQAHIIKKLLMNDKWVTCGDDKAQCLTAGGVNKWNCTVFKTDKGYRKPSHRECEAWQTVPQNYTNVKGVSNSQVYDVLGDGWTVDVIAGILKNIKENKELILKIQRVHRENNKEIFIEKQKQR